MKNHFETLNLDINSTLEIIKKRYHELALKTHPDITKSDGLQFLKIKEAYDFLCVEKKRLEHKNQIKNFAYFNMREPYKIVELKKEDLNDKIFCGCGSIYDLSNPIEGIVDCNYCSLFIKIKYD